MHNISFGSFYGIDSIFDILIALVAFFISFQSFKIYQVLKERNYKLFSWAFLTIGAAFLLKIVSNLTFVYRTIIQKPNFILILTTELQEMQLIHFFSFILFKIFLVMGFLILFLITTKTDKRDSVFLFFYLAVLSIFFSIYFNFIFHLTISVLLIFITYHFYMNYKEKRTKSSYVVFLSFVFILAGHFIDIFYGIVYLLYFIGEFLLLVGFILLSYNHIKVQNEPKTNKVRGDQRPSRHFKKK